MSDKLPIVERLEPCPWCDGPARVVKGQARYWGECQNLDCGAELGSQLTEAEAITAWNTRTETQSQATIDELVGALKPFATALDQWGDDCQQSDRRNVFEHPAALGIGLGDLRRARTILSRHKGGQS